MLALTAFDAASTRNLLSQEGMPGYEGVHTLYELGPCCVLAALDSLDALQATEGRGPRAASNPTPSPRWWSPSMNSSTTARRERRRSSER